MVDEVFGFREKDVCGIFRVGLCGCPDRLPGLVVSGGKFLKIRLAREQLREIDSQFLIVNN